MTTGKKSPKRFMKPNASSAMPREGTPSITMAMPRKKNTDALTFRFWKKKRTDLVGPMISMTPDRYSRLPMANSFLSKNMTTPSREKARPKAVNPMPILRTSVMANGADMFVLFCFVRPGAQRWRCCAAPRVLTSGCLVSLLSPLLLSRVVLSRHVVCRRALMASAHSFSLSQHTLLVLGRNFSVSHTLLAYRSKCQQTYLNSNSDLFPNYCRLFDILYSSPTRVYTLCTYHDMPIAAPSLGPRLLVDKPVAHDVDETSTRSLPIRHRH